MAVQLFTGSLPSLPFGSAEILQFLRVETSLLAPPIDAPLSRWVNGISGQTNTPSDSPLHVGHSDADFYVIVCCSMVDVASLR